MIYWQMHYKDLNFIKKNNKTDIFHPENIAIFKDYVFPIISKNEGWDTAELTYETFMQNPKKLESAIIATTMGLVTVLIDNDIPVALLERTKTQFVTIHPEVEDLMAKLIPTFSKDQTLQFMEDKFYYNSVGVVVSPNLQNKKKGYAEKLYSLLADGYVLGWTSNPIIVSLRKKLFANTILLPTDKYNFKRIDEIAALSIALENLFIDAGNKIAYSKYLGGQYSEYYVEERDDSFKDLTKNYFKSGRLTEAEYKSLLHILSRKKYAGTIISWNNFI